MTVKPTGPMPPSGTIDEFLEDQDRKALLAWAIEQHAKFRPTKVFYGEGDRRNRVNPKSRTALRHRGVGQFEPLMRERLFANFSRITALAGYKGPGAALNRVRTQCLW